jgi:hypothetical protein
MEHIKWIKAPKTGSEEDVLTSVRREKGIIRDRIIDAREILEKQVKRFRPSPSNFARSVSTINKQITL